MSLSIGIVGLPNVGKSTLFNALTKKGVPAENYPFCTIDPSVGIVAVPDERLWKLSDFSKSIKTIPAVIEFVDIAGIVEGASKGEGLGNKFLANIREVDAILHMVRMFPISSSATEITHVYGSVDPLRDIGVINLELILADMETVTKRRVNITREVKRGDKEAVAEDAVLAKIDKVLCDGHLAKTANLDTDEEKLIKQLGLLTMKKMIYGLNRRGGADNFDTIEPEKFKELLNIIAQNGSNYVLIDAKIEDELKDFEGDEKNDLRKELGGDDDGINKLIGEAYQLLGLETYFTTGLDETRAWTIKKGSTAPIAGMAIHTDFREKFIRAEVIFWTDLLASGSYAEARSKGLLKVEGKDYIVKDGDVVEIQDLNMKKSSIYFWVLIVIAISIDTVADISSKFSVVKNKNIYLIFAIFLYILSTFIWAVSLRHNDLSKATVIFNTLNIMAVVFAGIFIFKESLTSLNIIGIVLGIISVILLST